MAARLAPDNVRRVHQSLHHVVADAPWSDEGVLGAVRSYALTAMREKGPLQAWIVDDTGFPKKGKHSVGVARQYCGQVGKQENCRVAVSLSVSSNTASLPIAWRLYLPQEWADDRSRRKKAGIPEEVQFATKAAIALEQIRLAVEQQVPPAPVLADAAYGTDTQFRAAITQLGLPYVLGIQSSTSVWKRGEAPLPKPERKATGRPPKLLRRDRDHRPVAVKELGLSLPASAWKTVPWRQGAKQGLRSILLPSEYGPRIATTGVANRFQRSGS
jgi:SRSO17 transposase